MASPRLNARPVSRSGGSNVVAMAAYRARTILKDKATGEVKDYSRTPGALLFEGVYADSKTPDWVKDRERLWNEVEAKESRKNSRLAREVQISLPHELTLEQNRWLVQDWLKENVIRKGYAADVAIHAPHDWGDKRNIHAHILITVRKLDATGWVEGNKDREQNKVDTLQEWRGSWEKLANKHLERHGHDARIYMGSYADRGIAQEPTVHLGPTAAAAERRGQQTERGDQNREVAAANQNRQQIAAEPDTEKRLSRAVQLATQTHVAAAGRLTAEQADHNILPAGAAGPTQDVEKPVQPEGAIERTRREETEQKRRSKLHGALGELADTLRQLGRTMRLELFNVVAPKRNERPWVRDWLEEARQRHTEATKAPSQPKSIAQQVDDDTRQAEIDRRERTWREEMGLIPKRRGRDPSQNKR